jgi:AcrR family transcriptional regulator
MPDRRTEILDTALAVLAEQGMRGLTHRAVDQAAGLPAGSTSYYFRTRDALVSGCLHRLLELDRAEVPANIPAGSAKRAGSAKPAELAELAGGGLEQLADQATEACVQMITVGSHRTRARYELVLHSIRTPALHAEVVEAGTQLRGLIAELLCRFGAAEPNRAAEEIAAVMDGLVFTALVRGPRDGAQLRRWLRPALHRVLSAHLSG